MVFNPNAAANADLEFRQLAATGELAGFSTIMIYPYDEPEGHVNDQDMTAAIQMLRGVIANIPELSQAKFGVFYNCNTADKPGLAAFDWIGCDDYGADCGAISELTSRFSIRADQ